MLCSRTRRVSPRQLAPKQGPFHVAPTKPQPAEPGRGRGPLPGPRVRAASQITRPRMAKPRRVEVDGIVVVLDGLFVHPEFGPGMAAAEVGHAMIGVQADRPVVVGDGLLVVDQPAVGSGPLAIELRAVGVEAGASVQSEMVSSSRCRSASSRPELGLPAGSRNTCNSGGVADLPRKLPLTLGLVPGSASCPAETRTGVGWGASSDGSRILADPGNSPGGART